MSHAVTLLPGDWVGPECTQVTKNVLAAAGVEIRWEEFTCADGVVSDELLESARRTGFVLMNRMASPRVEGQLPAGVKLRKELGLWCQLRHVKNLPGVSARFQGVDLVVVRETSEDIYTGFEHETAPGVYESVKVTTEAACERIARKAFEVARAEGRAKVTIVHKSNIMKKSDGLFLRTAKRVAADYTDVVCDEVIVDALCMKLVRWPQSFDVLLCGNLFGDIVSDLAAGLAGGINVASSIGVGEAVTLFENPHGKAEDLVGTGRANPLPTLLSAVDMLKAMGETTAAQRIELAIMGALQEGLHTADKGGSDGCEEVEAAVLARL